MLHVQEFFSKVSNLGGPCQVIYSLEYTRLMGGKFDDTGLIVIRKKGK